MLIFYVFIQFVQLILSRLSKNFVTKMISSGLSKNSYSLQEFNKTIPEYQSALENSGYKEKLAYLKQELKNRSIQLNLKKQIKKQNKKNYLVQPPFNEEVSTNIGREYFYPPQ